MEEAFGKLASQVYGIETGISSDPGMNWQIPELGNRSILSFSDAHSAPKMAREATVFDLEKASYENIRSAIALSPTKNKIAYTLEFYPEEGKYHFSGHRNCKVSVGPDEIRSGGTTCRVCQRRMTEGVLCRVQELSDKKLLDRVGEEMSSAGVKWFVDKQKKQPPFVKLVPLLEIAAESLGSTVNSQKSKNLFAKLCTELESELHVLLKASLADIEKVGGMKVAQGVAKVRAGDIAIEPGYDGEYGKVRIWKEGEVKQLQNVPQLKLEF
ncbi:MAG: endonuclease Q family protein [Acidobacteriota bacterium]